MTGDGTAGPPEEEAFAAALAKLLPEGSAVVVRRAGEDPPPLPPEEREAVARAVPSRQVEFALGRAAARSALVAVGGPPAVLPVGPHRAPVWPTGFLGSISHGGGRIVAVVTRVDVVDGLGIDVEAAVSLEPAVGAQVHNAAEREAAERCGLPPVAVFSAKEAVHKAVFPRTGHWMDFLDVEVTPSPDGSFRVRPVSVEDDGTRSCLRRLRGWILRRDGFVAALALLPSSGDHIGHPRGEDTGADGAHQEEDELPRA